MKIFKLLFVSIIITLFNFNSRAQDIEVLSPETFIFDTIGSEMVFDFEIINISSQEQIVFEVRTVNDLPSDWTSSLCFGVNCFSPQIDSVATTPDFGTPSLRPGDTLITSLHVTAITNEGTANVQLQVGTFSNPDDRITIDFVATTDPTVDVSEEYNPLNYSLSQNYPNPFNPSTNIEFKTAESGNVSLKVYNILGKEIAVIQNDYLPAGTYEVSFNGAGLPSGIYFYKLTATNFVEIKKMTLEK